MIIGLVVVLVLGAGAVAVINIMRNNAADEMPSSSDEKAISVTGKIICLPPKDTTSISDTSCEIGLDADDGTTYALNADDPTITGGVPTGQPAKVTGSLLESVSKYDPVGTIQVNSLERL